MICKEAGREACQYLGRNKRARPRSPATDHQLIRLHACIRLCKRTDGSRFALSRRAERLPHTAHFRRRLRRALGRGAFFLSLKEKKQKTKKENTIRAEICWRESRKMMAAQAAGMSRPAGAARAGQNDAHSGSGRPEKEMHAHNSLSLAEPPALGPTSMERRERATRPGWGSPAARPASPSPASRGLSLFESGQRRLMNESSSGASLAAGPSSSAPPAGRRSIIRIDIARSSCINIVRVV